MNRFDDDTERALDDLIAKATSRRAMAMTMGVLQTAIPISLTITQASPEDRAAIRKSGLGA